MATRLNTKKKKGINKNLSGWLMAAWPLLGFILFGFIPMLLSIILSFTELKSYRIEEAVFNGVENFKFIFNDPNFKKAVLNTLFYCLSIPISLILGLLIAMLINQKIKGKKFFRSIFFIPYVCSIVAVSIMWKWMFNSEFGIINNILSWFKIAPLNWLNDPILFRIAVLIITVWGGTGFNIILYQAALASIDPSFYEAAEIEGAGMFTKFFKITLPAISPTTFYMVIMGVIGGLQAFTQMHVMVPAGEIGPDGAALTIVFYLYNMAFEGVTSYGFGLSAAVSLILAIGIIIITFFNFKVSRKWVHYDN